MTVTRAMLIFGGIFAVVFEKLWHTAVILGASSDSMFYAAFGIAGTALVSVGIAAYLRLTWIGTVCVFTWFLILAWPQCWPAINSIVLNGELNQSIGQWLRYGVEGGLIFVGGLVIWLLPRLSQKTF